MTTEIIIVFAVLFSGMILFAADRIPAEVVALIMALTLTVCGILTPQQTLAGISSDTVVTIFGILVLTAALQRTGVIESAGFYLNKFCKNDSGLLLLWIMFAA